MKKKQRVLIFPSPFRGHETPMMHLANLLHHKGFSITIIQTSYNFLNPSHFPHLTFHSLNDGLKSAFSEHPPHQNPNPFDVKTYCEAPFKKCLSEIMNDGDVKVSCLIVDPLLMFVGVIADNFSLPRIAFRTGGMSSYGVYHSLPSLLQKGYYPLDDTNPDKPLQEFPSLRISDLPSQEFHNLLNTVMEDTKTYQGMICNTFDSLENTSITKFREILPYPIFQIGPIHKHIPCQTSKATISPQDQSSIDWLNTQTLKSVLYISFRTGASLSLPTFTELAWGLANSLQPFLWVVRPGLVRDSSVDITQLLPEGYMDVVKGGGHFVRWAPQLEVLSHRSVDGFGTHCGWNSIMESICEGVPMLCLPFFGDQSINGRYVTEKWKIGLFLEKGVGREEIERGIRKLMVEEGKDMRRRITEVKEKACLCVSEGGSSCKTLDSLASYISGL